LSKRLVLLHTVTSLAGVFNDLCAEILPAGTEVWHVVDEILLKVVLAEGRMTPFIYRRVAEHAVAAEETGADAVMLTCSSVAPSVDVARSMIGIPILRVDEAMVDRAISRGTHIGVAATAPTTLGPTTELVQARSREVGRDTQVDAVLCEGAYDALFTGDLETHDRIVRDALKELMIRNDVVLLAQASMARAADTIPADEQAAPILSSPRLAVERARDVLDQI
jgi:Asp/Glu/hydantoin racemase